jgi:signal transduction histidine kinase
MHSPIKRPIAVALLIAAIVIVTANAWFAVRSINTLLQSEFWVDHTWQVIDEIELILGSAKDAETGCRGYLITGDPAYMEPYRAATHDLPLELDTFERLTSDNPTQQGRIVEMRAVLEQRMALLQQGIDLRGTGDTESLHAMVASGTGKREMDRVRALADSMEAEERRLLKIRTARAHSSDLQARIAIAVASCLDLLLIVFMFQYLRREQAMRLDAELLATRLAVARAESEARSAEVELLNATLEERVQQRTAELESTNKELEAFSYSVSHDLRAPLRTIDGFSLALEEDYAGAVDTVGQDYIRRVRSGVQRMGQLIDSLLQLSRITRAEIYKRDCDLTAIARSVAANLQEENPARKLEFDIEDDLKAVADPDLLQVALENLLGNAVKFSSKVEHPTISFGWDNEQNGWFVRDNGAGFDMHYASKLFNAFNRLHGDKDFKGSGIGLATVARVIRRHHGRIWADSVVDHGATFWFTLG